MVIRSKFKDYYDYIGHQYGQDKDVVYNRGPIKAADGYNLDQPKRGVYRPYGSEKSVYGQLSDYLTEYEPAPDPKRMYDRTFFSLHVVVAGGMVFPIFQRKTVFKDFDKNFFNSFVETGVHLDRQVMDEETYNETFDRRPNRYSWDKERFRWAGFQEALQALRGKTPQFQRDLNAPVFEISPKGREGYTNLVFVEPLPPHLGESGIPAVVTPEQMWQNIYSCFTNTLRHNPDKAPPVEISNQDKITKAGFDLKTSFRNPINPKPKKKR